MFYRRAGVRHTSYAADRRLWPLAFDRRLILLLVVLAVAAPWWLTPLYLTAWALPMVIWATAAMGLNLLMFGGLRSKYDTRQMVTMFLHPVSRQSFGAKACTRVRRSKRCLT